MTMKQIYTYTLQLKQKKDVDCLEYKKWAEDMKKDRKIRNNKKQSN